MTSVRLGVLASLTRVLLVMALLVLPSLVTGLLADCIDRDGDGYGAPGDPSCPAGPEPDCDDTNGDVYPGAPEVCDGVNNNCNHPNWPSLTHWLEGPVSSPFDDAQSVFAADVDGDDDLDVLAANQYGYPRVSWYENTVGDGSEWREREILKPSPSATSVHAADMDGDGDLDVLSAFIYEYKIAWYENTVGDGSVWTEREISTSAEGPESVFAADVDGDGDPDALSASVWDDKIAWYENTAGDGSVWTERVISTSANGARAVFAADVDGDDDVDVLSASSIDDTIAWYENTAGDGSVWTERAISTSANGARSVFAADVDGDNDVDVLSASFLDDKIAWYENVTGDGSAWTERVISTSADSAQSVFAADLDGDDDLDVLSASYYGNQIAWHENTAGDGSAWTERGISTSYAVAYSVFVADVDGDNDADVLAGYGSDPGLAWYRLDNFEEDGDGDGLAECDGDCYDGNPNCTDDCETDLDGDGFPYCADTCVDQDGDGYGDPGGSGSTCEGPDCDDADPNNWASCAGCVDEDADTFFTGCDAYITIDGPDCDDADPNNWISCATCLDMDGDGFFAECDAYVTISGPDCDDAADSVYPGAPEICDGVNNDCDDPIWPSTSFWTEQQISTSAIGASSAVTADVDGDDDSDVLASSYYDDTIAWYENTAGDGSDWIEHVISTSADGARSVVAADVDADNDPDVLAASFHDGTIAWYENTAGDGSNWIEHVISASAYGATSVFAADVDGDGDLDALSASWVDSRIEWFDNAAGDGSVWILRVISLSAGNATSVFAADVDGDGDVDVLSSSYSDDKIAWYENVDGLGATWVEHVISTSADGAWSVVAADMDDDGDFDVVSASENDHTILWFENMNGNGLAWFERGVWRSTNSARDVFVADVGSDGVPDVLSASDGPHQIAWYEFFPGCCYARYPIVTSAQSAESVFAGDVDGDDVLDVLSAYDSTIAWHYMHSDEGDLDGDGLSACAGDCDDRNSNCTTDCTDVDGDGYCVTTDCDDSDPLCTVSCTDSDGDGYCVVVDCDDGNPYCTADCADLDGDSFCVTHDCSDGDSTVYPGAPEANDGVDNQCPGDEGHGLIDEIEGDSGFHNPDDPTEYSWQAQPGATIYMVARFAEAENPVDCTMIANSAPFVIDPEEPVPGWTFHYLVHAYAPYTGSWGQDSAGGERTNVCP